MGIRERGGDLRFISKRVHAICTAKILGFPTRMECHSRSLDASLLSDASSPYTVTSVTIGSSMATAIGPPFKEQRTGPPDRRGSRLVAVLTLFPGPLAGTGYTLKSSMAVELETDEGGRFIVSDPNTGAFTSSDTQFSALTGFIAAFIEEYELLRDRESTLSPKMRSELERYRTLLEPSVK